MSERINEFSSQGRSVWKAMVELAEMNNGPLRKVPSTRDLLYALAHEPEIRALARQAGVPLDAAITFLPSSDYYRMEDYSETREGLKNELASVLDIAAKIATEEHTYITPGQLFIAILKHGESDAFDYLAASYAAEARNSPMKPKVARKEMLNRLNITIAF